MSTRSDKDNPVQDNAIRAQVTTPSEREIVITRVFDAPRTLVFEAWTKPEHVVHWWDPSGVPLAICEIDLRPGGAFRFVNGGPDGAKYPFAGIYQEIAAPERLVLQNSSSGAESGATLIFHEREGKTTLTMTIQCASRDDRDALLKMGVDVGTTRTLDNLDEYLKSIG
jgi:uncharacterized protein YndB with AHSA1/START domain